MNKQYEIYAIENDIYAPTGDPDISYPQLCIRTNRTAERSDLNAIIDIANEAAEQYPITEPQKRKKAVLDKLVSIFGGGSFGHAWIILFNSNKPGDSTTYGFHRDYGFVKNGTNSEYNDSPERRFHLQRCIHLADPTVQPDLLEKTIIKSLIQQSLVIAEQMAINVKNPENGAYTPISNCSWFAGQLWNYATHEHMVFEQDFNGKDHAQYWGMDFLSAITKIADPGMIAENISTQ